MVNEITNKMVVPTQQQSGTSNVLELKAVKQPGSDEAAITDKKDVNETVVDNEIMEQAATRLNEIAQDIRRDLQFKVDENSGDMVITVLDRETNEVIRQIPSEHVLALRENMESLKGILFSAEI